MKATETAAIWRGLTASERDRCAMAMAGPLRTPNCSRLPQADGRTSDGGTATASHTTARGIRPAGGVGCGWRSLFDGVRWNNEQTSRENEHVIACRTS